VFYYSITFVTLKKTMNNFTKIITGLSEDEAISSRKQNGSNSIKQKSENPFFNALKSIAKEPMVVLLLVAATIYFIVGKIDDGIFLALAIILVAAISLYQDKRSRNALEALKSYTQPTCKVYRDSSLIAINSEEIVINDCLLVEEGDYIAADGIIIESHDFSVNESALTGESFAVFKYEKNSVLQGSNVVSGSAILQITAIGSQTQMGKIGISLSLIEEEKTPLEIQINNFVKKMVIIGLIVFLIVWGINYFKTLHLINSLLKALTLAMSILPEEIPVAFTTFMAIGAWRLMKMGIIVKQMKTVETLGSATVICTDKTGTITENKMALAKIYLLKSNEIIDIDNIANNHVNEIISMAMWSSEPKPFDPMEIALHKAYEDYVEVDERKNYKFIHEYPLGGKPPMMTHIFKHENGSQIIAAKGAPEALIKVSKLNESEKNQIHTAVETLAKDGFRVLGVGNTSYNQPNFPKNQEEFNFTFIGLVAFYDPPKANIKEVLQHFYQAGIKVKIITGDNAFTTSAIAKKIDFIGHTQSINGDEIMTLNEVELQKVVMSTNIFTRMFPDAKLRVIEALKNAGQIVAMTGDGVNDGPALKAAHIGIAMGKKGTSIAKDAASLILVDDDLSKMVDAIAMGRKIYTNLKKAIQYIISIHIPIILTVFIPLILGWIFPNIFSPVHVIFLELIMGPTCSIIYENEPLEKNTMLMKPRALTNTFFSFKELWISIIQGIVITIGTLIAYQYGVFIGANEAHTRTLVFATLIASNIFLTLENRSFYYSILNTLKYKNNLVLLIIAITLILCALLIYVPVLSNFFEFEKLSINELAITICIGFVSVIWFEIVKMISRKQKNASKQA
jgi:Ca2+-transporting ATPase